MNGKRIWWLDIRTNKEIAVGLSLFDIQRTYQRRKGVENIAGEFASACLLGCNTTERPAPFHQSLQPSPLFLPLRWLPVVVRWKEKTTRFYWTDRWPVRRTYPPFYWLLTPKCIMQKIPRCAPIRLLFKFLRRSLKSPPICSPAIVRFVRNLKADSVLNIVDL